MSSLRRACHHWRARRGPALYAASASRGSLNSRRSCREEARPELDVGRRLVEQVAPSERPASPRHHGLGGARHELHEPARPRARYRGRMVARLLTNHRGHEARIEAHALGGLCHLHAPRPRIEELPERAWNCRVPARGEPGEVSPHDSQCQVIALTIDVGSAEPVESNGVARRALYDIRELNESQLDQGRPGGAARRARSPGRRRRRLAGWRADGRTVQRDRERPRVSLPGGARPRARSSCVAPRSRTR